MPQLLRAKERPPTVGSFTLLPTEYGQSASLTDPAVGRSRCAATTLASGADRFVAYGPRSRRVIMASLA